MSKLLKPLVILMFLLSIGALVLESMDYMKRQQVKGRTQKLENGVQRIATNLKYTGLNNTSLQVLEEMDQQINPLATAAKNKHDELVATTETLGETKDTLQRTEKSLEVTQGELKKTEENVVELNDAIAAKESEISRKKQQVADLEAEKQQLNETITGVQNDLEITKAELTDIEAEYKNLNTAFEECVQASTTATPGADGVTIGNFEGKILTVNPEWNFVVIDKGTVDEMKDNVILLIHRDTKPIGKVRVRAVKENIALAEIIQSWEDQIMNAGDEFISPKSSS